MRRVYPRACGGTPAMFETEFVRQGLSPRVRGNRSSRCAISRWSRSIPARAGEPAPPSGRYRGVPVYPRACGGTWQRLCVAEMLRGLSPRVRGNQRRLPPFAPGIRSIPARAGEPRRWAARRTLAPVYPRACGGTLPTAPAGASSAGLSPRVRGNLLLAGPRTPCGRSIPARAGEPRLTGPDSRML